MKGRLNPVVEYIVHFFTREKVVRLAQGFEIVEVEKFEEGGLPRKLFRVTQRRRSFGATGTQEAVD